MVLSAAQIPYPMKEVSFYLPQSFNEGNQIPAEDIQRAKHIISTAFGGCTLHPSLEGIWVRSQGKPIYDDIMIMVAVTSDSADLHVQLAEMADHIREQFHQDLLFFTVRDIFSVK